MKSSGGRRRVLVTAGLPYSNGRLHVGHLGGAHLPADIYVRYLRLTGADARYVCGSDDYGVAIMLTAEREGKTPGAVADFYRARQVEDFAGMGMSFDIYSGTSSNPFHTKTSQEFFLALHRKGYFEKQTSRQFYDELKGVFLPDRYVKGTCGFCGAIDQAGDQCESCGKVLDVDTLKDVVSVMSGGRATVRETVHWFLDLSRFREQVEGWLARAELRDQTRAYVSGLLDGGLIKRAMTRDISWGIPVPLDDPDAQGKVLYVWFDAPIGYISNTVEMCVKRGGQAAEADQWWRDENTELVHFIGEDNTVFHCIIWIAMLHAEGSLNLPKAVVVNHYVNIQLPGKDVEKMSKSRGTAFWIGEYLEQGGDPDSLRYYLTATASEKARGVFRPDDMELRHNGELADTLGNLVNRITSFSLKHCGPAVPEYDVSKETAVDRNLEQQLQDTFKRATAELEDYSFKSALEVVMEFARACNRYVDEKAPWTTRKTDMEVTRLTLAACLRAIHALGVMLAPFIPFASAKILHAFGRSIDDVQWSDAVDFRVQGVPLSQPPILFQKKVTARE
ncbi:MAG: methionine--tRNA ligase [Pseudomonadota bacterium]